VPRVLFLSDAGSHTGFAKVTEEIGNRLVTEWGDDVHCLAVNWRGDYWPSHIKMYLPTALQPSDIYGRSRYIEMIDKVDPDVIVMINDPDVVIRHLVDNPWDTERILLKARPLLVYLPMDGYNSPPAWEALASVTKRVAMTKFGQDAMPGSELVYHGVDTATYTPQYKKDAKRTMGFDPERFLILRVDKNSLRKNYADSWRALRPLLRKYPDIDVHFHCQPNSSDGINIRAFISRDEDIRDRVSFSRDLGGFTGWTDSQMVNLYSAADLFISTSMGEGFGLTIAESLACGTPVVAQNVSSITEVVGPGGVLIEPARPFTVPMGQEQMLPDVDAFTREIEHLYLAGGVRRKLAKAGREHVEQSFSWDVAAREFHRLITELAEASVRQEESHGSR
jgi:D-inositol-3-phosphate glycosyltransferase